MAEMNRGAKFLRELMAAVGASPCTQRIVIVADVRDVPRVYVKGLLRSNSFPGVVKAVADVVVDEMTGEVIVREE